MSKVEGSESDAGQADAAPGGLISPLIVGFATLLCGPVSGFWLLSCNDAVLRKGAGGWVMVGAGAVWVILSLGIIATLTIFLIPPEEESPDAAAINWGFLLLCVVIVMGLAHFLHGDAYRKQQSQGKPGAPRADTIKRVLFGWFLYLGIWLGFHLFLRDVAGTKHAPSNQGWRGDLLVSSLVLFATLLRLA